MKCAAVLVFVLACGGSNEEIKPVTTSKPLAPASTATATAPAMTDDARVRDFVAKLAAHDFDGAEALFDEKMHEAMPKEKLSAAWTQIESSVGELKSVDSIDVKATEGLRIVAAKSTFARAPIVLRVVYDAQNRVAGFFVAPGDSATMWKPPTYSDPAKFDDTHVAIGSSPALPGILSIPKNAKHYPIVVLVHGSGPNDADETISAQKPFKDLAYGLASRGVAVLRYEKRTRVDPSNVKTQKEEVDDGAHAAIAFARTLPDVDVTRVALLGHSQGGYLAPRIAKADPSIKRVVILAGSTRPLEDSFVAQLKYMATLQPNEPKVQEALEGAKRFKAQVESPSLKADDRVQVPFAQAIPGAYFLDVRGYRPERIAATLAIPILVLQGERDYQVTVAEDFPAWKTALGQKKNVTFVTYPTLNHAFTTGGTPPAPSDYDKPASVDEKVVTDIATFLLAP